MPLTVPPQSARVVADDVYVRRNRLGDGRDGRGPRTQRGGEKHEERSEQKAVFHGRGL